jgi:hypothetical protein
VRPPIVIFALPRSRTYWLSRYLSYADWQCGHDELRHCRSLDDVRSWLAQPCTGTVETIGAPFWRLLRHYRPDARIITVRRPLEAVKASLRAIFPVDEQRMHRVLHGLDRKLDQIEARTDAYRVDYDSLANEAGCAALFEHCLPYAHDRTWWQAMAPLNVQTNLTHVHRYLQAHAPQLDKLAKQAKHRSLTLFERPTEIEGVSYQCEDWDTFYRDAEPLFREHLTQTDQVPDEYERKNVPLFRRMYEIGALQVMTARSNGRMFGYLVSVIAPTLDAEDRVLAFHTLFFGSPLVRNLGMKLQRAALAALKARGVDEVQMRAGHRGAGPRLGSFYRRLGAQEFGQLYRLELGD